MFRYSFHALPSAVADAPKAAVNSLAALLAAPGICTAVDCAAVACTADDQTAVTALTAATATGGTRS
ncbi:hypothetical protein [Streptomyces sp. MST-110588]|uniref:hypothetical protein n=1 Tax=Streptomyces sp. MST-110588 TaxID=2833628 RepID=UPI001F5E2A6C|nr:hypothetical protein [Streptomyces sp. MST-110588]UNO44420.1 hypothetical protein KGS77_02110 [Streptomyces sp. MST-110588]